jgi:superfamily I DNA/RNA helicase
MAAIAGGVQGADGAGAPDAEAAERDPERVAEAAIRAAAPSDWRIYSNVHWLAPTRPGATPRDGEADLVLVIPQQGLLVIETKGGHVQRDSHGRWYAGARHLPRSPFAQATESAHRLTDWLADHPSWTGDPPAALHAVCFPEIDRASVPTGQGDLGPDAPLELLIDRSDLRDRAATTRALERILAYWSADRSRDRPLDGRQVELVGRLLEPPVELRPLLRGDIEEGERELLAPTHYQLNLLRSLRRERRAAIEGGAGSGKTILAREKARQLAADGFNVLLVCFNQPLARALAHDPDLTAHVASGRLTVSTFHELCRRLGREADVLPPEPADPGPDWWNTVLPDALLAAADRLPAGYQAVVVDEGQDFEPGWLESLGLLTSAGATDIFYLFFDPAQQIFERGQEVGRAIDSLGLRRFELADNCRNSRPIHALAFRFYTGSLSCEPLREDGREPEVVVADSPAEVVEAVRAVLKRLVVDEQVDRRSIVVLVGQSLERSAVWRHGRFRGGLELWNGSVDAGGRTRRLGADAVAEQPPGTILCETIHRFKGLERDVVVLCELRPDDARVGKLLYIGASRAKHHLVVIAPRPIAGRLSPVVA